MSIKDIGTPKFKWNNRKSGQDSSNQGFSNNLGIQKYKSQKHNFLQHLSRGLMHNLKDIDNGIKVPTATKVKEDLKLQPLFKSHEVAFGNHRSLYRNKKSSQSLGNIDTISNQ